MSYRDRDRSGTKIYVGNLSSTTSKGDLEYEFGYYGRLVNVWVAKNPPGFSYVEFEDSRDAEDAIKGLDGRELHGRKIRVERSHGMPRGRRDEGGRFARGGARRAFNPTDRCYNCGDTGHYAYDCDLYSRRNRGSDRRSRRSFSRSRSRSPRRRRSRRSRSYSRSRSRSPRRSASRSYSRSRSKSYSRSRSHSRGKRSRSYSKTPEKRSVEKEDYQNGGRSTSRSRSRSH